MADRLLVASVSVFLLASTSVFIASCDDTGQTGGSCESGRDCAFACFEQACVSNECENTSCTSPGLICVKKQDGTEVCVNVGDVQFNPGTMNDTGSGDVDDNDTETGSDAADDTGSGDDVSSDTRANDARGDASDTEQDAQDGGGDAPGDTASDAPGDTAGDAPGDTTSSDADATSDADTSDAAGDGEDDTTGDGGEGATCQTAADCSDTICVEKLTQPGVFVVFNQDCQNGTCTRTTRVEDCGEPACSMNQVVEQTCVDGACVESGTVIEDCGAKTYQKTSDDPVETGCYQCEEKNPARCELQSMNGEWGDWVPSEPADEKYGTCDSDGNVWHIHYCDDPPPSCGGIWCYWTTGAPGGPSSVDEPEFRCGPL